MGRNWVKDLVGHALQKKLLAFGPFCDDLE